MARKDENVLRLPLVSVEDLRRCKWHKECPYHFGEPYPLGREDYEYFSGLGWDMSNFVLTPPGEK